MSPTLKTLRNRLEYRCLGSEDYVVVIREIARTGDVDAVRILGRLLDSTGPIAHEAMEALVGFGEAAVPEMVRRRDRSMDSDVIRHAKKVLARIEARTAQRVAA